MAEELETKKGILFIGLVCEDIIFTVPEYPKEDDKMRCSSSVLRRGGNAGNCAVVLSLLNSYALNNKNNYHIYFLATLSNKQRSSFVISDLNKYKINTELCIYSTQHEMTVSYIVVSSKTKSRTIINNPCLKALSYNAFIETINKFNKKYYTEQKVDENVIINNSLLESIDNTLQFMNEYAILTDNNINLNKCILDNIEIIHIDARWISSMIRILCYIKKYYPHIFISIEIEKERLYNSDDGRLIVKQNNINPWPVNDLIPFADCVFFSRQLVKDRGYANDIKTDNPNEFIKDIIKQYGNNRTHPLTIVIPWGDKGAFGIKYDCSLYLYDEKHQNEIEIEFAKSYPPKQIVDTIGAGDTYIAAYLHYALNNNIWKYNINQCLKYACQVAGFKIGYQGFDCVKQFKFVNHREHCFVP